jgi:hypothetical protein
MLQLFEVTLAHDKRSVLLNNRILFPKLPTIPRPPTIYAPVLRPDLSYRNLSFALGCRDPSCRASRTLVEDNCREWCSDLRIDTVSIDYLYITKGTEYNGEHTEADTQYWEFNVDVIGGPPGYLKDPKWGFDNPSQKMLRVVVEGTEVKKGSHAGEQEDSLFGPLGRQEKTYDYRVVHVELVEREFSFPARELLSFKDKISRFFGNDVWEAKGRLVYISDEWSRYGKEGTLRNLFGDFIHWYFWELIAIIVGSAAGGLLVIYGICRLFVWVRQQRELMRWNGMDDVWDKLRREREEEENALLDGRYRDEPDEGGSPGLSRFVDDVDTMKPLPTKPLPEKPLPEVPLIDA